MYVITKEVIEPFGTDDPILRFLEEKGGVDGLTCDQWLKSSLPKRYIFDDFYSDLLHSNEKKSVLDIGGGVTSFTEQLVSKHDYFLAELLAHGGNKYIEKLESESNKAFLLSNDWYEIESRNYDLVVANDIFPNVDQRLEMFLDKYVPLAKRMKLSLTFYEDNRFYFTKRLGCEEVLCYLAWDSSQILQVLRKYKDRIVNYDESVFDGLGESVYPNGRHVCLLELCNG